MVSPEQQEQQLAENIPVIDMANTDDTVVAKELIEAFCQIGFATLIHHGVSPTTIQNGFASSKRFFDMPVETKLKYKYQSHSSNRGYIAMGSEKFESLTQPDRKETFDIGKEGEDDLQTPWPEELLGDNEESSFKDHLLQYFHDFNELNLRIMRLLAIGLGLSDETFLVDRCNEQHCNLRLLHYPELKRNNNTETIVRGAIHTDYGSITLLSQDSIGGLRAQRLDGSWIGVKPVEGSIIVNVGDMLERWTNGLFTATPHQVIDLPMYQDIIPERYSIAFFCNVNKEVVLDPMTSLNGESAKYEPMKAIDYITMRLSQTISSS